jgi:hypothetical protein
MTTAPRNEPADARYESGRITFPTRSAEPGKDGVADYTRILAAECARRGAACQIVALHDRHVDRIVTARAAADVDVLRLPRRLRWRTVPARSLDTASASMH